MQTVIAIVVVFVVVADHGSYAVEPWVPGGEEGGRRGLDSFEMDGKISSAILEFLSFGVFFSFSSSTGTLHFSGV